MIELPLPGTVDSEALGAALARAIPWPEGRALSLFLSGDLGAGKTTVVRGLLHGLGVGEAVRSPTYTLLETYEHEGHRVLHLDLYRLGGSADLAALGLRDELEAGVMLVVEWPERALEALPAPDIQVWLSMAGEGRAARLQAGTEQGAEWLSRAALGGPGSKN